MESVSCHSDIAETAKDILLKLFNSKYTHIQELFSFYLRRNVTYAIPLPVRHILSSFQEIIFLLFYLERGNLKKMYQLEDTQVGEQFCLFAQRARKTKKILRLIDYASGYLLKETNLRGNYEYTESIFVFIDYLEPCCLLHALSDLEEEFLKICIKKYNQECEMRSYFVEGIEKVSEDNKIIEVELLCGT